MGGHKESGGGIIHWPDNSDARAALTEWIAAIASHTSGETPRLVGDFLDFRGADLSGLDLMDAYLVGSCLAGVRFRESQLGNASLSDSDLRGTDFTLADLAKAELVGCVATNARFRGARVFAAELNHAVLDGADFRHAILNSAKLYKSDLRNANLEHSIMKWCTLGNQEMPTLMTGARMFGSVLEGASGVVVGPILVGEQGTVPLDGHMLEEWFTEHGADQVHVVREAP